MKKLISFILNLFRGFTKQKPSEADQDEKIMKKEKTNKVTEMIEKKPAFKRESKYHYIIDAGHGLQTPGKRSQIKGGGIFREYKFNRIVKDLICLELEKLGLSFTDLVPESDIGNVLLERIRRCNLIYTDKPKILISIHFNAGPGEYTKAEGIETWYKSNSKDSEAVAKIFQQNLIYFTGAKDRGIKSRTEREFFLLRKFNGYAAILTENGFFNNHEEVQKLVKITYLKKIARAHIEAIKEIENF